MQQDKGATVESWMQVWKQGWEEGREDSYIERTYSIASNLLNSGVAFSIIQNATGLTLKQIWALIEKDYFS